MTAKIAAAPIATAATCQEHQWPQGEICSWLASRQSLSQHGGTEKAALVLGGLFSNPGQITYVTYVSSGDGGCGGEFTARFLFPQFILIIIEVLPKNYKP